MDEKLWSKAVAFHGHECPGLAIGFKACEAAVAPVDKIFSFSEPRFDLPERARLFETVVCEICGEGASELKMHLQDGKAVCADCFESYSRGW